MSRHQGAFLKRVSMKSVRLLPVTCGLDPRVHPPPYPSPQAGEGKETMAGTSLVKPGNDVGRGLARGAGLRSLGPASINFDNISEAK
jgi:hypothetical protein